MIKTFTFPNDIPSNTAIKKVLIATQGFADLGLVMPDYIMPNGFLATDGATVNYAGVSQMSYGDAAADAAADRRRDRAHARRAPR